MGNMHEVHVVKPPEAAAMPGTRQTPDTPREPSAGDLSECIRIRENLLVESH